MPVYLYWGEEDFNLENAVLELRKQVLDPEWKQLNHRILNDNNIQTLIESLQTLPMMFGNLLFEVKSSNLFFRGGKKAVGSDEDIKKLLSIVENLNENIHLLFVVQVPKDTGKKIDSSLKITKTIEKIGKIEAFNPYKSYQEKELLSWITQRASNKKIKITNDAAQLLLKNTGHELRKLNSEIEKLIIHIHPEKTIGKECVLALSSTHENIFLLADYIIQNQKSLAISELNKLLEKEPALRIMAVLQTSLRKWLKIKIESQSKDSFTISKMIGLHEYVVKQEIKKLKNISIERFIQIKDKLTKAETQIKTGEMDARLSLELAILSNV